MKRTISILLCSFLAIALCVFFSACANKTDDVEVTLTASWEHAYSGFEELYDSADAVAMIKVISHEQKEEIEGSTSLLMTYYDVEVNDIIKGTIPKRIVIPMTGGVSNGKTIQISDDPLMQDGESYIVFVDLNPRGTYTVLGGPQGRYIVEGGKVYSLDKRYEAVQPAKGLLVDGTEYDTFKSGLKK